MKHPIVLDLETHYSTEFTLSKMSTMEYALDPRFEYQSVAVQCPIMGFDSPVTIDDTSAFFKELRKHAQHFTLIGHNSIGFDAFVLALREGIHFGAHEDTSVMSRYVFGGSISHHSLEALSEMLNHSLPKHYHEEVASYLGIPVSELVGRKASKALDAVKGKRRCEFTPGLQQALDTYCRGDVLLTDMLHKYLRPLVPALPYRLMQYNAKALLDTPLELDVKMLEHLRDEYVDERSIRLIAWFNALREYPATVDIVNAAIANNTRRVELPEKVNGKRVYGREAIPVADVALKMVRSKSILVDIFLALGVPGSTIPTKQGKNGPIPAFAKNDLEFAAFGQMQLKTQEATEILEETVSLRMDYQTSIYEKRASTLARIGKNTNGRWAMHVKPYGALNTGRMSAGNAAGPNCQNMPRAKETFTTSCGERIRFEEDLGIRDAICAPEGKSLVVYDSSGIELRCVGYITQETNITDALSDPTRDLYVEAAREIFKDPMLTKKNKQQRFMGKLQQLSCLAADTEVLTEQDGWIPIVDVKPFHRVWDGVEWVNQGGLVYRGDKETITRRGVRLTPCHLVLVNDEWITAGEWNDD